MARLHLLLPFLGVAGAQFVRAPDDLASVLGHANVTLRYKPVPAGICEQDARVKSYSGYADVAENEHIFFWFFEARNADPEAAPLTIWLNGGPGASSMVGLFQELGPCGIDYFGEPFDNPFSWSESSNMLFIDQPTTVGLSYSIPAPGYVDGEGKFVQLPDESCTGPAAESGKCGTYSIRDANYTANSTLNAAPRFWKTLQGFVGAFPQYAQNGVHFACESYGGHYGPVFSSYIQEQNRLALPGTVHIDLQTLIIINGWFSPLIQYGSYYNYSIANPYDVHLNSTQAATMYNNTFGPGNCLKMLETCIDSGTNEDCINADRYCQKNVEALFDKFLGRDELDIREKSPDPFPYKFYRDYLNKPSVQQALGAFTNFSEYSSLVSKAFGTTGDDARELDILAGLGDLLRQNVSVVFAVGDADYNCNIFGVLEVAEQMDIPGYEEAGFEYIETEDGVVHGEVRQAGNFAFVRVYESGHEMPFYQPLFALRMFERAIARLDISQGLEKVTTDYTTIGPRTADYKEGNGTVQWERVSNRYMYNTTTSAPGSLWPGLKAGELKTQEGDGTWRHFLGNQVALLGSLVEKYFRV